MRVATLDLSSLFLFLIKKIPASHILVFFWGPPLLKEENNEQLHQQGAVFHPYLSDLAKENFQDASFLTSYKKVIEHSGRKPSWWASRKGHDNGGDYKFRSFHQRYPHKIEHNPSKNLTLASSNAFTQSSILSNAGPHKPCASEKAIGLMDSWVVSAAKYKPVHMTSR